MHESNVVATTNLVAAARSTGVGRFVHMGSTSVYGEEVPLPQPVLESVEPHPSRGYGKAKWLAEKAVWAAVADGLPAVVLRPVSVFGPGAVKLLASAILDVAIEDRRQAWEAMLASGMEKAILFTEERFRFLKKANRNNRLSVDALLATGYRFRYGDESDLTTGVAETIDRYRQQRWIV